MNSKLDANTLYPAETKTVEVDGISMNPGKPGDQVGVLSKGFLNSYNPHDHQIITNLVQLFASDVNRIDQLLVVIRNGNAKIYRNFPMVLNIRAKEDIKAFTAVFDHQVLDINGVAFKDAIFNLDVVDGDKFLWLFRNNWSFGLYFDFSKKLKSSELSKELGTYYRTLHYYSLYSRIDDESFKTLLARGWFPFIQLIPKDFENLASCCQNENHVQIVEQSLLEKFDQNRIMKFSENWWRNEIFSSKRTIIEAGLNAFLAKDQSGAINSIKNLFSEIEGILRIDYLKKFNRNPSFSDLKTYIRTQGENKFADAGSLGFPGLFFDYLDQVTFKKFDLVNGDVTLSRHSSGHGVAADGQYSRERALQLILTLDQIYHYLSGT